MDPMIAETILGHWNRERSVNERYGRLSDAELLRAVDSMTFDNGETEILVSQPDSVKKGNWMVTGEGCQRKKAGCDPA